MTQPDALDLIIESLKVTSVSAGIPIAAFTLAVGVYELEKRCHLLDKSKSVYSQIENSVRSLMKYRS